MLDATELGDLLPLAGVGARHRVRVARARPASPARPRRPSRTTCRRSPGSSPSSTAPARTTPSTEPASTAFWRDYQPPFWPGPTAQPDRARPADPGAGAAQLRAQRRHRPGRRRPEPRPRRQGPLGVPPDPGPPDVFEPGFADSDVTIVNWPMIDYLPGPLIGVTDGGAGQAPGRRRGSLSSACSTGCRPRRPRPDGGTGWPGLRLRGDVMGTRRRPREGAVHPRVPPHPRQPHRRRAGPVARGPRRARRRRLPGHRRRRHVPHRPAPVDRRRHLYRRRLAAPSRFRSARCCRSGCGNLLAGRQEHRHHAHHQRLLPPAPGRVEHRRGRRRARRPLPRRAASSPHQVHETERLLAALPGRARDGDGFELAWPEISGY